MSSKSCQALLALVCFTVPASPQTTIQYGNTVSGGIECGTMNQYTLIANAGDKVVLHVTEIADGGGICFGVAACAFDQCVEVRDDMDQQIGMACTPLESNACAHQLRTQLGPLTIPRTGRYTITVRDANNFGRGRYALSVQKTNPPVGAQQLTSGEMRLVPFQTAGEIRAYAFAGLQDQFLKIDLRSQLGVAPRLALYGPDGEPVALPESGQIQEAIRQGGQHALLAFSAVSETGTAQLSYTSSVTQPGNTNPVISQIADGNGWRTTIILVNNGAEAAPFSLRFWTDAGTFWNLNWDGPADGMIPAGGSRTINTLSRESVTQQGWAELSSPAPIGAVGIFRSGAGQEAAVSATVGGRRFVLPFDNTQGMVTSIAVVNTNATQAGTVRVTLRDETGTQLDATSIAVLPRGHDAFAIPDRFGVTRGRRGVVEFSMDSPHITGLGLRFAPGGAFTSIPVQAVQ
jgi:hypothetical protein